ncbi:MAG TPA: alpha/beta hydrolase [Opitutaceae bacterium]|jgi:pimeloyl-ACP methyl ester carboxylesterase|nr:alpha/beta hydrolase [Opitutaceae bacterium]
MEFQDDELLTFEAEGAPPLPETAEEGYLERDGARIWFSSHGTGKPVILLHGGLGHGGNWGHQVPVLVESGHRAIVIDSRGHGRSTRDARPYTYALLASDVLAVMDALGVNRAAMVGWSDGATVALVLAMNSPERVQGVFFFACNMDASGVKPFQATPALNRCFSRHGKDYARLSATPDAFMKFVESVSHMMNTDHNSTPEQLAAISVPVAIVQSERDEFIKPEHAQYLARTIPGAEFIRLDGVSHFAPLQRPARFNAAILGFLDRLDSKA